MEDTKMTREELIERLTDIEWDDFEVKEAREKMPDNVWETVSAFSNVSGGWIVFGVRQKGKHFFIEGVENGEKTESDFLNTLRNGQKFNHRLIASGKKYNINHALVLAFFVPSSPMKPIWFGTPQNTFIRSGSGDRRATDMEVMALYRDQAFGTKSEVAIDGTTLSDLNPSSLASYRQHIINFNSEFPYKDLPLEDFCRTIGITKKGSLTYGSLLMFGKRDSVQLHVSNFWIDYLEIPGNNYSEAVSRYTYRMPEQDNLWEYYQILIQRLRLHVDAPFTAGPDGYSPDDNSQLYCIREGLVNMLAHADFFSTMHCTIRVYDNRIEFQNPGRFMRDMETLRQIIKSNPRNPSIIKFFRYAKLSENAGYGIDKMIGWERLTGKDVMFETDLTSSTVTYFRKETGMMEDGSGTAGTSTTTPKLPPNYPQTTPSLGTEERIIRIIRSTPNITKDEIARMCGISIEGVRYQIRKLRKAGRLTWEGHSRTGRWIINNEYNKAR